ncbi:hypothetical protein PV328_003145 [Microctonus aethiopoides]|uniref:phospholipase A1 n=1 Tax=Microctonus aethiopoides TaxID=144406 RepID=A0AA39KK64_9HYME|nr:hypothetical protein PV328_003145 [Microctonus aethiopoides]
MKHIYQVYLLICMALTVYAKTICYEDLGCFSNNYPWFTLLRPFPLPHAPEKVNTTFHFSTQGVNETFIPTWPQIQMHPKFDARKPTYFITHGYSSGINTEWFHNLTNAILNKVDGNVFAVDWATGSSGDYFTAASNTRIVGSEIARVINHLKMNHSLNPATLHLLGHSLGSHIMAYVGKNITNPSVNRITALDPAQPGFEGKNPIIRLDESDASFIDVIHTDGRSFLPFLGLGMTSGVGTVDLFVNGGKWQPNCILDGESFPYKSIYKLPKITINILYNLATCSHSRAPRYMAAAIKESCHMWAHRYHLESASLRWRNFIADEKCDKISCTIMGLQTTQFPARGNFVIETSGTYPFCVNNTKDDQVMKMIE